MFEVDIIRHIQLMRHWFADGFFSAVTLLGDELFFMAIAAAIYWCYDKRFGFKLINVYLLGCACVEAIKGLVGRERPYTHGGIESVGEKTSGGSFPSGHSHSIANLSTQLSQRFKRLYVIIPAAAICLLVAFSRLYMGQHYLSDVLVGLMMGVMLAMLFSYLFELLGDREDRIFLVVAPLCFVAAIVFACLGKGEGTAMKVLGGYSAVAIGYFIEKRFVCSEIPKKWYLLLLRLVLGLGFTVLFKEVLKFAFPATIPVLYDFLRYFITALVAILGMPALFKALKI